MIVLDASICAPWFLGDERSGASNRAAMEFLEGGATVPGLWMFEIRNVLLSALRRRRIDQTAFSSSMAEVENLKMTVDHDTDWTRTMAFAVGHGLTVYDAAYMEPATRLMLPLATLDRQLADAARASGVRLIA